MVNPQNILGQVPDHGVGSKEPASSPIRRVSILGATGSVGANTLDLISRDPGRYAVCAVTAFKNAKLLSEIAIQFNAEFAVVGDPAAYAELADHLAGTGIECAAGADAVVEAAGRPADIVFAAIVGSAGLSPTLSALESGRTVAVANKECLVCAGHLFMDRVRATGATLLPVDSEHNAVFQVFDTSDPGRIERVTLTASGGPFRTWPIERMAKATPAQALDHPNWSMGDKISIDSATLMNKGLEVIEAYHLFPIEAEQLEVLVHPQSVVHGLVSYSDGSVLAQLGAPDMRTPISYCLEWPRRGPAPVERLDLAKLGTLTFEAPDLKRFPALGLALAALRRGAGTTNILNAANEVAVDAFLRERIKFNQIPKIVDKVLEISEQTGLTREPVTLEEALSLDQESRELALASMRGRA